MIIYSSTKRDFLADVRDRDIDMLIAGAYGAKTGRTVNLSEFRSWRESLREVALVLDDHAIPSTTGVAIEYHLPQTSKRIDVIVTGKTTDGLAHAVIVELKQWSTSRHTDMDGIIIAHRGGLARESQGPHPSYQAWSYASLLESFNEEVHQHDDIRLHPCAYLHNHAADGEINHPGYQRYLDAAPLFLKGSEERERLRRFIREFVRQGDQGQLLYRLEHGRVRPSRMLADSVDAMLRGNDAFVLIDDQKLAFETILSVAQRARDDQKKQVVIVRGGPGTGKSVLAIHLMGRLLGDEWNVRYVTKNSAPRDVYSARLIGKGRLHPAKNLFIGSGAFTEAEADVFDALIVDEAHRLNERSGLYGNLGQNQVMELIRAARCTVFFVDDDQRVTLSDIGDSATLLRWAQAQGAEVTELELASQFRCQGSDGYLAWIDNALGIRDTANPMLGNDEFDFRVFDDPVSMHAHIERLNTDRNRARVVAGYCWKWASKKNATAWDIEIPEAHYRRRWNLSSDGGRWIEAEESVDQVGCVHTSQGLEVDHIGVIIGHDLAVRDGVLVTIPEARSSDDKSIRGWKAWAKRDASAARAACDVVIRNTYRTLLTRGMRSCSVYCVDPQVAAWFRARMLPVSKARGRAAAQIVSMVDQPDDGGALPADFPWTLLQHSEAQRHVRAVPVVPLKIAAGRFSDPQSIEAEAVSWVELPDFLAMRPGLFIAQVIGESMNRRIPNGAWCLFRSNPQGTREGKVVLAEHRSIADADTGGSYTVKVYRSTKEAAPDEEGGWRHVEVRLLPDSDRPEHREMRLDAGTVEDLRVVAEFLMVVR